MEHEQNNPKTFVIGSNV